MECMTQLMTRDGRRLAYELSGPADGDPVVFFHGGLFSRLVAPPSDVLAELGVRLVTFDRPGYGGSDPSPTSLADRVQDVEDLLAAVDVERARLVAWSAGVLHALACAALIPQRVSRVDAVASKCPNLRTDPLFELARHDPDALRAMIDAGIAATTPAAAVDRYIREQSYLAAGRKPAVRDQVVRALTEGLRQGGAGAVADMVAMVAPWEFSLDDVRCPVRVWHGADDVVASVAEAEALTAALVDAELSIVAAGHDAIYELWHDVLAPLSSTVRSLS